MSARHVNSLLRRPSVCKGDGRIESLAASCPDVRIALHLVRQEVSIGLMTPEEGVDKMLPLSTLQEVQLRNCLNRISLDQCVVYGTDPM